MTTKNIQPKKKSKAAGCLTAVLIFFLLLAAGMGIGWSLIAREHAQAANLPINGVDFNRLPDGDYPGAYAGGMYAWRTNQCTVSVESGKVVEIRFSSVEDPNNQSATFAELHDQVIARQTVQVDAVSGATLTSKAYLKCIDNALSNIQ